MVLAGVSMVNAYDVLLPSDMSNISGTNKIWECKTEDCAAAGITEQHCCDPKAHGECEETPECPENYRDCQALDIKAIGECHGGDKLEDCAEDANYICQEFRGGRSNGTTCFCTYLCSRTAEAGCQGMTP
jgi:hypothetical protein